MYYNLAISPMYPKSSKTTVEVKIDGANHPLSHLLPDFFEALNQI